MSHHSVGHLAAVRHSTYNIGGLSFAQHSSESLKNAFAFYWTIKSITYLPGGKGQLAPVSKKFEQNQICLGSDKESCGQGLRWRPFF